MIRGAEWTGDAIGRPIIGGCEFHRRIDRDEGLVARAHLASHWAFGASLSRSPPPRSAIPFPRRAAARSSCARSLAYCVPTVVLGGCASRRETPRRALLVADADTAARESSPATRPQDGRQRG